MQHTVELREWVTYEPTWLIIGSVLAALLVIWYASIFWFTRHKKPRSLHTLQPRAYTPPDLTSLKAKYLQLIAEVESSYAAKTYTARTAHHKLSYLLRMFVCEINGHRVDTLTLADLKKSRYPELAKAIEQYYIPEFASVEHGSVADALTTARKVVTEWN